MKRRTLLKAAAVAAGAATWPGWLRGAFAAEDCSPSSTALRLAAAYRRAAKAGRPLLVLVIPEDDGAKWVRGALFGAFLNFGSDEQLAPLALADVQCATMKDVRQLAPSAPDGEPVMALIETEVVPARVTTGGFPQTIPRRSRMLPPSGMSYEDWRKAEAEEADKQIAATAHLARTLLAPDQATLERRVGSAKEGGGEAAALLAASTDPSGGSTIVARLAALTRARLKDAPVPGARWAHHSGCGATFEDLKPEEQPLVACGMGHVPEKSERFLSFYAKPDKR